MAKYYIPEYSELGQDLLELSATPGSLYDTEVTKSQLIEDLSYLIRNAREIKQRIQNDSSYLEQYKSTGEESDYMASTKKSFNDMVQKQRQKSNQLIKNLYGKYGEIRQIKKERYELENYWIYLRANQIDDLYKYQFTIEHSDCCFNYLWYIYQKKEDNGWYIVLSRCDDDPYIEQCQSLEDGIYKIDEKVEFSPDYLCSSVTHY